ncbi:hypothetical protein DI458_16240 [Burkholderia contaminans]|uniref:Uncharacterized protein n=1 Tax=Burkholderia contaminans LMG 23361 TaxID=1334628 RepID=A0ABD4B2S5_9BURK|nr:hypothetical protein WR31_01260 [Burkholderia contaminans LMG 23361]MBA9865520.1 hypothetical protein [Burkholderia contaminans]MBA9931035.1 hypothetical protein [Burkholderia contaminans]MCB4330558.1 hypothetical protein [Burkholderia contaminans]ODN23143.1 hypothetical protein BGI28_05865 [Burkholderia contaminans]
MCCRIIRDTRTLFGRRGAIHGVDGLRYLKGGMTYPDSIAPLAFRSMDDQPCLQRFDELRG